MVLAVPGVAYVLSPLRRKRQEGGFDMLTRSSQLEVGVPRSFAIIDERAGCLGEYPREPVGSVWLIRQPAGSDPPVLALQSECPHLGSPSTWRTTGTASSALATPVRSTSTGAPRTRCLLARWTASKWR